MLRITSWAVSEKYSKGWIFFFNTVDCYIKIKCKNFLGFHHNHIIESTTELFMTTKAKFPTFWNLAILGLVIFTPYSLSRLFPSTYYLPMYLENIPKYLKGQQRQSLLPYQSENKHRFLSFFPNFVLVVTVLCSKEVRYSF